MKVDVDKLSFKLKEKGLTKSSLVDVLGLSSRTIAKFAKSEDVSLDVVSKISGYLGCKPEDILEINEVLRKLKQEKQFKLSGGFYHNTQIKLTYNSNHIEGSTLTEEQTRYIFETKMLGDLRSDAKLDDVIETNNHFRCIDYIIDYADVELDEKFIGNLHFLLMQGTSHSGVYGAGVYKKFPNTVGGIETARPEDVSSALNKLLKKYKSIKTKTFEDIVEFHYDFERIHPFQDGNGRVGRLIAFKECLKNNIVPFFIDDRYKVQHYKGLSAWGTERGYLLETCRFGQDMYKRICDYFDVKY